MNAKRILSATTLTLMLASCLPASASNVPTSQFGFTGWPYRQQTGCTQVQATTCPTEAPVATTEPTVEPTVEATSEPTLAPTSEPTLAPTEAPTPTAAPTAVPTAEPTKSPESTSFPTVPTSAPSTSEDYTTGSISVQEENTFLLLNADRAANGLGALALDQELCRLARLKSQDMNDLHYFAHTSPTYGSAADMLRSFGYSFTSVGENIAHHATVDKAQAAFMSSTGHRRNILGSQWSKVGIGVVYDSQGFVYVTQLFVR